MGDQLTNSQEGEQYPAVGGSVHGRGDRANVTANTHNKTVAAPAGTAPPDIVCAVIASAAVSSPTASARSRAAVLNGPRRRTTPRSGSLRGVPTVVPGTAVLAGFMVWRS